ncbi:MAG: hypothetical protein QM704_13910 [Anaeromyxobacteraceae bacterium]
MTEHLSPELRAFAESGVSIHVGTADARLVPEAARVMGCRVEPGGDEVTLFVPRAAAGRTLDNLALNGRVAAVFARPLDDLSFQLKGAVLEVRDATEADRPIIERYRPLLSEMFQFVGIPSRITFAIAVWPAVAVRFRVESIFVQTPGPKAGAPLVEGRG